MTEGDTVLSDVCKTVEVTCKVLWVLNCSLHLKKKSLQISFIIFSILTNSNWQTDYNESSHCNSFLESYNGSLLQDSLQIHNCVYFKLATDSIVK